MDPIVGILSPATDANQMNDALMLFSVENPVATLSSISEIEEPESTIMSTSLLFTIPCMTAALGWTAAATAPVTLARLRSWDAPAPSGTSLGSFPNDNLEPHVQAAHTYNTF